MSRVADFVPTCRLRQVDHIEVRADPAKAYAAFRHLDVGQMGFVRALFALRTVPFRLAGRPAPKSSRIGIDPIAEGETPGFLVLLDRPGEGVVIGSIGRFWEPDITFANVAPDAFAAFAEPGWGKLAWSIWAEPRPGGGSIVTFELRVTVTDESAATAFARYFSLIGPFSHAMRRATLGLLGRQLGRIDAPSKEEDRALPGDDLVPDATQQITYAIDIDAPASVVWPYLVQLGKGRAGWYSYDRLDNDGRPSAANVVPDLQRLAVGDLVPTGPGPDDGYVVRRIEAPNVLVLGSDYDQELRRRLRPGEPPGRDTLRTTWAFVIEPVGADACRLVTRVRGTATKRSRELLYVQLVAPIVHAVMERKQLREIKRRAERDVSEGVAR